MERERKIGAFKETLIPHLDHWTKTHSGKLMQLKESKDLIIRPLNWTRLLSTWRFSPPDGVTSISAEDFAAISKRHFDELRQFGINIPASFVVAEKEAEKEEVFAVVRNIITDPEPDERLRGESFAQLRMCLLQYYTKKHASGGSFLADLYKDQQYVYGRTAENPTDQIYLVDVEPRIFQGSKALRLELQELLSVVSEERDFFDNGNYDVVIGGIQELIGKLHSKIAS